MRLSLFVETSRIAASVAAVVCVTASCGSDVDTRPAVWAYISPVIFQPNCATSSCHSPAAAVAGLDFSDPDRGYTSLTGLWVWIVAPPGSGSPCTGLALDAGGIGVCEEPLRPLVTPYDPEQSRVVDMLRARNAPRMPPDRPLDEADIRLVEKWILNGAKKTEDEAVAQDAGVIVKTQGFTNSDSGRSDTSQTNVTTPNDASLTKG